MIDSFNSTRQAPPTYQLKRPTQGIPIDDILDTTAEDLLGSVVTTLQHHSHDYESRLDRQKRLYSSYIQSMAKSQVPTLSTKTVTKSCNKSASCKQPAIFQGHTTHLDINTSLKQEALDAQKQAFGCFFTMVDSRVCTQTAVSLSRINSVVCQLSHPDISNIQRRALLDLAWSCLTFLWEHLNLITNYPPTKSFLREASKTLAPAISGNTTTMDHLLAFFESDHRSIVFLCHAFQYSSQHHSMTLQHYQRITLLIQMVQKEAVLDETPSSSSSLSQQLAALEYLIGSFDIESWANSDTATNEDKRQEFYLLVCEFIRQQTDWQQGYAVTDQNSNDGTIQPNLVTIAISHMMTVMTTFMRKQKESVQGEHLYVLHLLLDTLVTAQKKRNNTLSVTGMTTALDTFIDVLSQQGTTTMIVTQQYWKQQNQPEMRFEWSLLNDPGHTLDTILALNAQLFTTTNQNQPDLFEVYGGSVTMALARLTFGLLLDPRVKWDFKSLVRYFELFWKPSTSTCDTITTGQMVEQDKHNAMADHSTDAQRFITQLFGLLLDLLLSNQQNKTTLQSELNDVHQYFYESLLHELDVSWINAFLPTLTNLPWAHLSPLCSDVMETMLTSCVRLQKDNRSKYVAYSSLVYSILSHTVIADHQHQMETTPPDHYRLLHYVGLSFTLLMTADWIWPNEAIQSENIKKLWGPIMDLSGELTAEDMDRVVEMTGIDDPSNWQSSLDRQETNGASHTSGDQNRLATCIRWMRHLTIVEGDAGSMKLVAVFGRFILAHLNQVADIGVQMNWLKVLLDQADGYITKHDTTSDFDDCVDWFRVLVRALLDGHQQCGNGIRTVIDTICEAIFISDYSTTLAMFTACIPPLKTSTTLASAHTAECLASTNLRLEVMESCLEHCLQLRHSDDVWLRVGALLHDIYANDKNRETTTETTEVSISEYIRLSMDLSCFLVLNGYCHAKLQQFYFVVNDKNEAAINNDHHVAEEIAAILSMAGDGGEQNDVHQPRKRMVLIRSFAHLLSRNKTEKSLELWLASVVSLTRTCSRWSTLVSQSHEHTHRNTTKDDGQLKSHGYEWTKWSALLTTLECFLASRLAMIGIPPYSGMIPKDKSMNKMTIWLATLEQKKKIDTSRKSLFDFAIDAIQDLDHWTLWELDDYILRLESLSFGST